MPGFGFDGTLTESAESNKIMRAAEGAYRHVVWSGGDVTVGTGMSVNVSAVDGHAAGIWFTDNATSIAIPNGASNPRIDYIVEDVNWSSNSTTVTRVAGAPATSPIAPTLVFTPGTRWQVPLARVRVPANATTLSATNIEVCKPLTRATRLVTASDIAATTFAQTATNRVVSTATVTDPGWPYFIDVSAGMIFTGDSGYARLGVLVDGGTGYAGTEAQDQSGQMTANSGDVTAKLSRFIGPLVGAHTVTLVVSARAVGAGFSFQTSGGTGNYVFVRQVPAP